MRISLAVATLARVLTISIVVLGLLHLLLLVLTTWVLPGSGGLHIVDLVVNVDQEGGLPMWFSTVLLAITGLVALDLAGADRPGRRAWATLGAVVLFLSVDEAATIHERIGSALEHNVPGVADLPFNAWVLVYVPLALLVLVLFVPHLRSVPKALRRRLVLAGALYVLGAAGMEIAVGLAVPDDGSAFVARQLFALGEEMLELAGAALLLLTLVTYRTSLDEGSPTRSLRPAPA
jgi:hypothetical protein